MKSLTKPQKWFGAIVTAVVLLAPFCFQHPPDSFEMVFNRPVGGEERKVQTVQLYCFEGPSKGAPESDWWCQEKIISEREE